MTRTLKKQWIGWFSGALTLLVLTWSVRSLQAQSEGAATPGEAAQNFFAALTVQNKNGRPDLASRLISAKSQRELGYGANSLVEVLAAELSLPNYDVKTSNSDERTATVEITPSASPAPKPIVCVEENGVWRVDLVQTYAKWHNLDSNGPLQSRIFELTGAVLPGLPQNSAVNTRICQSNLKQIGLGFRQYVQDYDEKFPTARSGAVQRSEPPYSEPFGWADAIQPYLKSTRIYQCPTQAKSSLDQDAVKPGFTDYWFNSQLSRLNDAALTYISNTVLSGDGNDGGPNTNARYNLPYLPKSWRDNPQSPAFRHDGGANYLFADGHVKKVVPSAIYNAPPSSNYFSFQPY